MKRIVTILMGIVMLIAFTLSMTACGGEIPDKDKDNSSTVSVESKPQTSSTLSDEEMIIGSWVGKMSVSDDFVEKMLGVTGEESNEMSEMLSYFDINSLLNIDFTLTFNENGTYTMMVSDEAVSEYIDNTIDVICDGMLKLMKDIAKEGDMTWEEYLAAMEMTEQGYKDAVMAELDKEELIESFKDEVQPETEHYKLEGGKMYTADDENFEGDDLEISDYELTETTLKISYENKLAATFTKVK